MTEELPALIVGSFVWLGLTFFTVRDILNNRAEVQFVTGYFTPISRDERPRAYWAVTILRLSLVVILGAALAVLVGAQL